MQIAGGHDLLAKEMLDVYSAENSLSRALPRFLKQVSSEGIREKLQERLEDSKEIIEAIERELDEIGASIGRKKNLAIEGLLEDAKQLTEQIESEDVFDAAFIAEMQKIQHYCMAAWGTIAAYAREGEQQHLAEAMERVLENGKRLDEELTELAEHEINPHIFAEEEHEDGGHKHEGAAERGRRTKTANARSQRSRREESSREARQSTRRAGGGQERARADRDGKGRQGRSDLRGLEYRDSRGEIHHHTRAYSARHRER
jgi:ferritin-like metal-binding protein YciE